MDGRDAMLAVGMNGEPLPLDHGFPVRMVVPGLYGYVSASKWIKDIELTTFDAFDPYWVKRGLGRASAHQDAVADRHPEAVREGARSGRGRRRRRLGPAPRHRPGRGPRRRRARGSEAELAAQDTIDTWRQWPFAWDDATPGSHTIAGPRHRRGRRHADRRARRAVPRRRDRPAPVGGDRHLSRRTTGDRSRHRMPARERRPGRSHHAIPQQEGTPA